MLGPGTSIGEYLGTNYLTFHSPDQVKVTSKDYIESTWIIRVKGVLAFELAQQGTQVVSCNYVNV